MLSCAESLKYAAMMRRVAADMWEPTWLPVLAYDAHQVFVDCGQDRDDLFPVRVWDAETDDRERHRFESFTDLVALSVRLLESGYSTWSAEYRMWVRRRDLVPGDACRTGLI
jgi:hypothetical protein